MILVMPASWPEKHSTKSILTHEELLILASVHELFWYNFSLKTVFWYHSVSTGLYKYKQCLARSPRYKWQVNVCQRVSIICICTVIWWLLCKHLKAYTQSQTKHRTYPFGAPCQRWWIQTTPVLLSHYWLHSQTQKYYKGNWLAKSGRRKKAVCQAVASQIRVVDAPSPSLSRFHAPSLTSSHFCDRSLSRCTKTVKTRAIGWIQRSLPPSCISVTCWREIWTQLSCYTMHLLWVLPKPRMGQSYETPMSAL